MCPSRPMFSHSIRCSEPQGGFSSPLLAGDAWVRAVATSLTITAPLDVERKGSLFSCCLVLFTLPSLCYLNRLSSKSYPTGTCFLLGPIQICSPLSKVYEIFLGCGPHNKPANMYAAFSRWFSGIFITMSTSLKCSRLPVPRTPPPVYV